MLPHPRSSGQIIVQYALCRYNAEHHDTQIEKSLELTCGWLTLSVTWRHLPQHLNTSKSVAMALPRAANFQR
jgi:hypothetical protein